MKPSKNVEDIRNQKPKKRKGSAWNDLANPSAGFSEVEVYAQEASKKKKSAANAKPVGAYKKMAAKVGKGEMANAAKRDAEGIETSNRKTMAEQPLSPDFNKTWKVLDEPWTPKTIK